MGLKCLGDKQAFFDAAESIILLRNCTAIPPLSTAMAYPFKYNAPL